MAALFPRWTNTALGLFLSIAVMGAVALLGGLMIYVRMPFSTGQSIEVDQPVEFDHRHHVTDDRIGCLYCHASAERAAHAGVPATDVCMGCHNQIWSRSPLLEPVRRSYFSGLPIPWVRVHDLPDFVYFHHGVHVQAGIGCVTCHGRVDLMARVVQVVPLTMGWCLDCHRAPAARLADRAPTVTEQREMWGSELAPLEPEVALGGRAITRLTTCTACHR